jgi:hypothetical protein
MTRTGTFEIVRDFYGFFCEAYFKLRQLTTLKAMGFQIVKKETWAE